MEGKYTKAGTIIGGIGLIITIVVTIISFVPKTSNDLSGEWLMTSTIEKADLKDYIGAEVEWKMYITECDNKIKGSAEKIKINGEDLDYSQRTSLEFEGIIEDNNKLVVNYIENGKRRKTNGIIKATFSKDNFEGVFSQTASSANGKIKAEKIIPN